MVKKLVISFILFALAFALGFSLLPSMAGVNFEKGSNIIEKHSSIERE
jgi:hypothetical protein